KDARAAVVARSAAAHLFGAARLRRGLLRLVERLAHRDVGIGKPEKFEMPIVSNERVEFLEEFVRTEKEIVLEKAVTRPDGHADLGHDAEHSERDAAGKKDLGIVPRAAVQHATIGDNDTKTRHLRGKTPERAPGT